DKGERGVPIDGDQGSRDEEARRFNDLGETRPNGGDRSQTCPAQSLGTAPSRCAKPRPDRVQSRPIFETKEPGWIRGSSSASTTAETRTTALSSTPRGGSSWTASSRRPAA